MPTIIIPSRNDMLLLPNELGKPPSYYSCMITRNRQPSASVLENLLSVTKTILATFIGNPHYGKSFAVNLNHAHEELQGLVERVTIELELMNVAKELERLLSSFLICQASLQKA